MAGAEHEYHALSPVADGKKGSRIDSDAVDEGGGSDAQMCCGGMRGTESNLESFTCL